VQFVAGGDRPDPLADGGAGGAGNPDDHLAGRQFARVGGHPLSLALAAAIDEGFGADVLDRLDRQAKRDAAGCGLAGEDKILRPDPDDPEALTAGSCLRSPLVALHAVPPTTI